MNDLLSFVGEPWTYDFMRRAFLVSAIAGIVCGVVGTFVVLRGMAFISDAVAHSVFPGVAVGFALGLNLTLSGAVAGLATALAIAALSQNRRLGEDAVIGVLFAVAFSLGIVVVSSQSNYTGDLASFLFGQLLGVSNNDLVVAGVIGSGVLATVLLVRKELVTVALDRETALAAGLPVARLDALLYMMVALAVVISLHTVGNILALALIVTPAASARLLTDRLSRMMLIAAAIGGGCCIAGLYVAYGVDLASGGVIVLILGALFLLLWLFAPKHGSLARLWTKGGRSANPGWLVAFATLTAVSVAAAVGSAPSTAAAQSARPIVLEDGHVDAFQPKLEGGRLVLYLHDDSAAARGSIHPADVLLVVAPEAEVSVPNDPEYRFLGKPGDRVWVLPQAKRDGLLWPGLSTEALDGQWDADQLEIRLRAVETPPGGRFYLFEIGSRLQVSHLWRSDDAGVRTFSIGADVHAHMNWVFTRPGMYQLVVEACGRHTGPGPALGMLCSAPATYAIQVKGITSQADGSQVTPSMPATVAGGGSAVSGPVGASTPPGVSGFPQPTGAAGGDPSAGRSPWAVLVVTGAAGAAAILVAVVLARRIRRVS